MNLPGYLSIMARNLQEIQELFLIRTIRTCVNTIGQIQLFSNYLHCPQIDSQTVLNIHIGTHVFIILMSRRQQRSPWPSPATCLYRPSPPVGIQGYILYQHKTVVYKILAGGPAFDCPCEGVHGCMLLISSSFFLQQCPACLVRLTWIFFVMGGKWQYSCYFAVCFLRDLFSISCSILA